MVALLLQSFPGYEDQWSVLSVHRGPDIVARRRLTSDRQADLVRGRFGALVRGMSDGELEQADWQRVLDGVQLGG